MPTLATELQALESQERRQAATEYAELLARHDNPRPGDLQRLRDVMARLGRVVSDLEGDRALAAAAHEHAVRSAAQPAIIDRHKQARIALHAAQVEAARRREATEREIAEMMAPVEQAERAAGSEMMICGNSIRATAGAAARWAQLAEGTAA